MQFWTLQSLIKMADFVLNALNVTTVRFYPHRRGLLKAASKAALQPYNTNHTVAQQATRPLPCQRHSHPSRGRSAIQTLQAWPFLIELREITYCEAETRISSTFLLYKKQHCGGICERANDIDTVLQYLQEWRHYRKTRVLHHISDHHHTAMTS